MISLFSLILSLISFWIFPLNLSAEIILSPGQTFFFPVQPREVKTEAQAPFTLKAKNRGVELFAKKMGSSPLSIQGQITEIVILSSSNWMIWKKIEKVLNTQIGMYTHWSKGELVLVGQLHRIEDWQRVLRVTQNSDFKFKNHIRVSKKLGLLISKQFQQEVSSKKIGYFEIEFQKPWKIRHSDQKESINELKKIANAWGIELMPLKSELDLKPVIKVEIAIAELKVDMMRKIGLQWPTSFSAKVLDYSEIQFDDLVFAAHALESKGQGKVLARPNLLARSGSEAEFLAGGEFPIKIKNFASQDVVWKKYGVLLKILPQADMSGKMSLKIDTEISQIDMSKAVDGVPGLTTNRVSSHFDLNQSQTVALSGLLRIEQQDKREGLPFLSRIPLLGSLFSSKDYLESKSELVIFVRPQVVRTMTETSL